MPRQMNRVRRGQAPAAAPRLPRQECPQKRLQQVRQRLQLQVLQQLQHAQAALARSRLHSQLQQQLRVREARVLPEGPCPSANVPQTARTGLPQSEQQAVRQPAHLQLRYHLQCRHQSR